MAEERNSYGQPIGPALDGWSKRRLPPLTSMIGRYCRLERLDADRHAAQLYAAYAEAPDERDWTYMSVGPFANLAEYVDYARIAATSLDPLHHVVIDSSTDRPVGTAALMRIDPDNGVIELGAIAYSPSLQRTKAGTEAIFLLMRRVFEELGYRRCEWKCDSLNGPSRRAAERYGFQYEGVFRQAMVYKGRNRDTAWFSITDRDWPTIGRAFEQWLAPNNFGPDGLQRRPLSAK